MKNDTTTTLLNFVLAVLVILGVAFALLTMRRTSELRDLQSRLVYSSQKVQSDNARITALLGDVIAYNKTANNPELAEIIREATTPPPAPAPQK